MVNKVKLKRQSQTGAAAVNKRPTVAMLDDGELAVNTVDGKLFLKKTPVSGVATVVEFSSDPFPPQSAGTEGMFLTTIRNTDPATKADKPYIPVWSTPTTMTSMAIDVTQNGHGFTPGTVLYHTGTQYARAKADNLQTADVIGIVSKVISANAFTMVTNGYVDLENILIPGPWIAGKVYYLSALTSGTLTDTEPKQASFISKPLMIAITSARGFFYNWRGIVNDIPVSDIDQLLPAQGAATAGKVLTSGADGNSYWGDGGTGAGGASSTIKVTQANHNFVVGTLVRYDGTAGVMKYVAARANNGTNADVVGIVSAVAGNDITITTHGVVTGLSGLTPGASYFLSDQAPTAGQPNFVLTEPSALGSISKPVLMAITSTSALFTNWRGIGVSTLSVSNELPSQTGNSGKYLSTNGTATTWTTPVTKFNTRTGDVTLSSKDVTDALGFTPYRNTNPDNFLTATTGVTSVNGQKGDVTISLAVTSAMITSAGGALLSSPTFTGTPKAPTVTDTSTSTDQIATTKFVQSVAGRGTPSGAVMYFARSTAPAGWLKANGTTQSIASYPDLFAAIGHTFARAGDVTDATATVFRLPDLRSEFVRGWDDGRGVDTGRLLGSAQAAVGGGLAEFQSARNPAGENNAAGQEPVPSDGTWSGWRVTGRSLDGDDHHIRMRNVAVADVRPRNVALLACIKT